MSRRVYEDNCTGCRPAMLDMTTGKPMAEDSPAVQTITRVWERSSRETKVAFHNVTCNNSREKRDMDLFGALTTRMQIALEVMGQPSN